MKSLIKSKISFFLSTSTATAPVEINVSILHAEGKLGDCVNSFLWRNTLETYGTDVSLDYKVITQDVFNPKNPSDWNLKDFSTQTVESNVNAAQDIATTLESIFQNRLEALSKLLGYSYTDFGGFFNGRGMTFFGGNKEDDRVRMFEAYLNFRINRESADMIDQNKLDLIPQRNQSVNGVYMSVEAFSPARKLWEAYFEYADHAPYLHYFAALAFIGKVNNYNSLYVESFVTDFEDAEKALKKFSVLNFDAMFAMKAGDLKAELELWGLRTTNKKENLERLEKFREDFNAAKKLVRVYTIGGYEDTFRKLRGQMSESAKKTMGQLQHRMMAFYNNQKAYREANAELFKTAGKIRTNL